MTIHPFLKSFLCKLEGGMGDKENIFLFKWRLKLSSFVRRFEFGGVAPF